MGIEIWHMSLTGCKKIEFMRGWMREWIYDGMDGGIGSFLAFER